MYSPDTPFFYKALYLTHPFPNNFISLYFWYFLISIFLYFGKRGFTTHPRSSALRSCLYYPSAHFSWACEKNLIQVLRCKSLLIVFVQNIYIVSRSSAHNRAKITS